ncbi:HMA2 domain-containing protein [Gloeothece verrucosa]|uniref:Heavy metal translocating P-type ATPase n=1 Tax=Gloeothece verrucosa (strain PCC 7822) TaxID=497965 RepID=E0UI06_GLOV7|nr:hypothetical protein [Gloeothece verrucosa]ADN14536.1 hypothetical protein Cyan7822_2564 [Gloeothece verrucosa PCC 7822]
METASIGIILSILSAAATAVWTVWTWSEEQEKQREQKRDQISALYVNPFLLAAEELQRRLYDIVNGQELKINEQKYLDQQEASYFEALELLYVIFKFFGWQWYIYRYGPYTRDKKAIALGRKISETFANRTNFTDEAFRFSFAEQRSLGQMFVKPFISIDNIYPELEAIPLYEFETQITEAKNQNTPLYQNIAITLQAIQKAKSLNELEGRERLKQIQDYLVDLLIYLEGQEGFSVTLQPRPRAISIERNLKQLQHMGNTPTIIHQTEGRMRLRIPRLHKDSAYAELLQTRMKSLTGVQRVTINVQACSMTINYAPTLPEREFEQMVLEALQHIK